MGQSTTHIKGIANMKASSIREGMIFEEVKTKKALGKDAAVFKDCLYEVISVEEKIQSGYSMVAIWLGNILSHEAMPVGVSSLNNPTEWRYHQGASVKEERVIIKKISFMDRDSITLELEPKEAEPVKKQESLPEKKEATKKTIVHAAPKGREEVKLGSLQELESAIEKKDFVDEDTTDSHAVDAKFYAYFGSYTYDDLELLCDKLHDMPQLDYKKKKPPSWSRSSMVHSQEWSAFKDSQKTVREVRELNLRIKQDPSREGRPCTFQTVLRRLMQALIWYGTPQEKQWLTRAKQNFKESEVK